MSGAVPSLEALQAALDQLTEWGNLESQADTSRVATIEEFYKRRLLSRMTAGGEAVEAGLETFVQTFARRAELQSVALDDILARLQALAALGREDPGDAAKIHAELRDLVHVFEGLGATPRRYRRPCTHGGAAARRAGCRCLLQIASHRLPATLHRRSRHTLRSDR